MRPALRRWSLVAAAPTVAGLSLLPVLQSQAATVPAGFVYRQGRALMLDGSPYRFVGFNNCGLESETAAICCDLPSLDSSDAVTMPVGPRPRRTG